ncbi:hypothetical protein CRE_10792 [Caenorhabditis remanei]|uniref:Uncharacterized protein n=1 Tax=Caenorhabditis remanei TaxID=31234 RepID=E3NW28_CAERE|nr:hypothetical protein CRE_10792 [Caenorhabditis remanei]
MRRQAQSLAKTCGSLLPDLWRRGVRPRLGDTCRVAMAVSLIYLFESRSSSLKDNKYRFTNHRNRIVYYLLNYLVHTQIMAFVLKLPEDQEAAKLEVLSSTPCPTKEFFTQPVFVLLCDRFWSKFLSLFTVPILAFFDCSQITFFMGCLIYHLYVVPSFITSSKTRKLQRHFFIGIVAQTGVPTTVFLITYSVLVISYLMDSLTQGMMNMCVVIFGIHGFVESCVIIVVHEAYRKEVLRMFTPQKGRSIFIFCAHK